LADDPSINVEIKEIIRIIFLISSPFFEVKEKLRANEIEPLMSPEYHKMLVSFWLSDILEVTRVPKFGILVLQQRSYDTRMNLIIIRHPKMAKQNKKWKECP